MNSISYPTFPCFLYKEVRVPSCDLHALLHTPSANVTRTHKNTSTHIHNFFFDLVSLFILSFRWASVSSRRLGGYVQVPASVAVCTKHYVLWVCSSTCVRGLLLLFYFFFPPSPPPLRLLCLFVNFAGKDPFPPTTRM